MNEPGAGAEIAMPVLDWWSMSPVLVVFAVAVLGIVLEAFLPRRGRATVQVVLAVIGLVTALLLVAMRWVGDPSGVGTVEVATPRGPRPQALMTMVIDGPTLLMQGMLLLFGLLAVFSMANRSGDLDPFTAQASATPGSEYERVASDRGIVQTEVIPLVMMSLGGMLVFCAAGDLLTMFVALEVFSLPLYILCGMARRRRLLSQEASLKYFLLGAFSSAVFLFGAALIYTLFPSVNLYQIGMITRAYQSFDDYALVLVGLALVIVGLLFKVGAAPFHTWTPDVYTGAPTPVTGFMAACTKVAAFGALARVLMVGFGGSPEVWQPIVFVVASLTMVVGAVVGVLQKDIKRVLAYSAVAHAGFILVALAPGNDGRTTMLFYLLAYGFTTLGAFAVVSMVRERAEDGSLATEATSIKQWAGLGRRSPLLAAAFTVFLLAMAGIPLTSGFIAKFVVFTTAIAGGHTWLAVIGVLSSAVAAFYYLRIIRSMYFDTPKGDKQVEVTWQPFTSAVVAIGLVATVVIGVLPSPVLELSKNAVKASFPMPEAPARQQPPPP